MNKQTYSGPQAIVNYLQPDTQNYTPLVELPAELNPFLEQHRIHIYVKLLNTLPLANVKSLPAWSMLEHATQSLVHKNIVESSSGNTVFSLGILAKRFGVQQVKAVASRDVTQGKLDLLRIAGVDVQLVDGPLCPSPNDPKSSITIAKKLGETAGWYNPGQYDNDFNPQAHRDYTGPQIYEQLDGEVAMFAAGLGTTGTLVGTSDFLRSVKQDVKIIGVVRVPNNAVPGVRTKHGLEEVAFAWRENVTDELVTVNEHDSYEKSLAMIRQGLLVGPSAGFAYAGVLKQLEKMQLNHELETLKDKNVVFIAPDSMFPYVGEYFDVLDDSYFSTIDNQMTGSSYAEASNELADVAELTVEDVYNDYVESNGSHISQHYQLVDIRDEAEFTDHHLPDSSNVPYDNLASWLDANMPHKPIVFICRRGSTSLRAAQLANQSGVQAYSMLGGTTEWSAKDLPRIKNLFC